MASSQVEIASSSPFGCVLRDRNHRDGCRESNVKATHAALQRNIKNLVMDHLNTCMSMSSSDSSTNENENNAGSWASNASNNSNNDSSNNNKNIENLRLATLNNGNNKDESSLASLISPRHSRLLDRWPSRQARAMVSTLENEVEFLSIHNSDNNKDDNNNRSMLSSSSTSYEESSEVLNLGASSLVQIWEKRLNKGNGSKPNNPVSNGRTSPNSAAAANNDDNALSSEAGESCYLNTTEEKESSSFSDWESNSDLSSSPQGMRSSSEAAEGDRVCVAEIIKRLTSPKQGQSPQRSLGDDNDLLKQLENGRHGELNNLAERRAVSKFTQSGRIQSLLRLKLLQRDVPTDDQCGQQSTLSGENKQPHESAIMQLRERFSTAVEHKTTVQTEVTCSRSSRTEIVSNTTALDDSPAANQPSKDTHSQTVTGTTITTTESIQISMPQTNTNHNKETACSSSHVAIQETSLEVQHDNSQETAKATPSMTDSGINEAANKVETSKQQYAVIETTYEETVQEEKARDQNYAESNYDDMLEEAYDDNSYDWISEISRPRSYWEERRQAWYREMLATDSENEDIRTLLERRAVSTFLTSNFRETMDRLMHSHRGTQTQLVNLQDDDGENQGFIAILQARMRCASTPQEDGRDRVVREKGDERRKEEEETEEENSEQQEQGQYEVGDYSRQSSSPTSWSYRDNESGDDFDRTASTTPSQPSQSHFFCQNDRSYSSSTNRNAIEMEPVYDLRGQIEQLYHEMAELRKSIKCCMEMQMQLQQSMNQEFHTVKKEEKKSHNKAPKKGNCCICYDMKVDSVLYRCGHMCACLKCANELQWKGGKCPICRAKIVDVVRVFVHN